SAGNPEERGPPLDGLRFERQVVEAADELADGDLGLDAGEVRAEAVVRTTAEGEVVVRLALDVEAVRIGKASGVPIGRGEHAPHLRVLRQHLAAELDVGMQDPPGEDDGTVEAEALLDRAGDQIGARAELGELAAVSDELAHAVADETDRGLEAGDEETDRLRQELERIEAVPRL